MSSFDHNNPHYLPSDDSDVEHNPDYFRQDHGGIITNHNGVADKLLKNNKLYNALKGDWTRTDWTKNQNIKTTTGRENGKFYIQREQMNVREIMLRCQDYRKKAEQGAADPLAPLMPDGKLGHKWMELPKVISQEISDKYFGGMPWHVLKNDRTLKAQFYKVVEQEYNQFVCYPGGKLPIPMEVSYPTAVGQTKFFKGH
jgi:hypothetical protein